MKARPSVEPLHAIYRPRLPHASHTMVRSRLVLTLL
jgi:hypothetical protein